MTNDFFGNYIYRVFIPCTVSCQFHMDKFILKLKVFHSLQISLQFPVS